MKQQLNVLSILLAGIMLLMVNLTIAGAQGPPPPSSFWGTVQVNGANVADDTEVTAWINGTQLASAKTLTWEGNSVYSIAVPDGNDGETITFQVGGLDATQTGTWRSGENVQLKLTAGGDLPDANFECTPSSGPSPLTISCTDASTDDVTGWSWDFGDGTTSTDQNPTHTYNANGSYTVSLMVTGPDGDDTESKADYISVSDGSGGGGGGGGGGDSTTLTCENVVVYPNGTIAVSLMAQGTDVYGLQTTVEVSDAALVDLLDTTFGDFFTQPIAIASNQKDATTDRWLGGASQQNPNGPVSGARRFATLLYKANDSIGEVTLTISSIFSDRDGATIPSADSTCTLTIQPFGGIDSTVTYQGRSDHSNIAVAAAGPRSQNTTTNTSGAFMLELLPDGTTYQVTADAQSYLPACTTATVAVASGEMTTLANTQLRGGDLNDDLIINIGDATRLSANFNNPASADSPADINDDGTINIGDWSILQGNYDLAGCQSWPS